MLIVKRDLTAVEKFERFKYQQMNQELRKVLTKL